MSSDRRTVPAMTPSHQAGFSALTCKVAEKSFSQIVVVHLWTQSVVLHKHRIRDIVIQLSLAQTGGGPNGGRLHMRGNTGVEPAGMDVVVDKVGVLDHLHAVVHNCPDLPAYLYLL